MLSLLGIRICHVLLDDTLKLLDIVFVGELVEEYHLLVRAHVQRIVLIQNVRDTAAHSRSEILSGRSENDRASPGHVLASMIPDALSHGNGSVGQLGALAVDEHEPESLGRRP